MMITVTVKNKQTLVISAAEGSRLSVVLAQHGVLASADCGGRGVCGKCKIKLLSGNVREAKADKNGYVLACRAVLFEDVTVELLSCSSQNSELTTKPVGELKKLGAGAAVDIGTTNVVTALFDLKTGRELGRISEKNAQAGFGADVISRIGHADKNLDSLTRLIRAEIGSQIERLEKSANVEVSEAVVSGNTVMLHLFAGVSPTSIGVYPYRATFLESRSFCGGELGVPVKKITLMPSVSAYIGGDVIAGLLTVEWTDDYSLFIDLGTNGEMVLFKNGKAIAASTAAGPAFEGACIECGSSAEMGAISAVYEKDGKVVCSTVGGGMPKSICGAGLIDAVALLLKRKTIDKTGAFLKGDKYYLSDDVYISQTDIRQFQLAKSAVCSGIQALLSHENISASNVKRLYLAGGVGFYLDKKNAKTVGLLPYGLERVSDAIGNASLAGARLVLLDDVYLKKATEMAEICTTAELADSTIFNNVFINNLNFN
jgi:Uncharacterized metal-binding protein